MFYLTKQRYWHDEEGRTCLELVSELDAVSPGCIEFLAESDDPREVALAAIEIQESVDENWPITTASIMFYGNPDDELSVEEVNEWAEKRWAAIPKCDECGDAIIGKEWYTHEFADDEKFCREYCADENYWRLVGDDDEQE